jgi:hypothetical protein
MATTFFHHTPMLQLEDDLRQCLGRAGTIRANNLPSTAGLMAYSTVEIDAAARNLIERGEAIATPPAAERSDDLSFETLTLTQP